MWDIGTASAFAAIMAIFGTWVVTAVKNTTGMLALEIRNLADAMNLLREEFERIDQRTEIHGKAIAVLQEQARRDGR